MKATFGLTSETEKINFIVKQGAAQKLTDKEFLAVQIAEWKHSRRRMEQITGERYYNGFHDILYRKRTVIGRDGRLEEVKNLPNEKIIDNQYAKMVDQKANYLVGKPVTFQTDNKAYADALKLVLNRRFWRVFRNLGEDSIDGGIGWLMPYYTDAGEFLFRRFEPYEILPFWEDAAHTVLDAAVHLYETEIWNGSVKQVIEQVELFAPDGIYRYILQGGVLQDDSHQPYSPYIISVDGKGKKTPFNWSKIPLTAWKFNAKEIPLIRRTKPLQDAVNLMLTVFENNMLEDSRNTILVVVNYGGTNLDEFRYNLAAYGAINVKDVDGHRGGVETLQMEVNSENYKAVLKILKDAMIENARGYDAKDDRLSGQPNEMNIQSMYSDIDLDANSMETEYQAAFEELLWFVNSHLYNTGAGDFFNEPVQVVFNRDVLTNTSGLIQQVRDSDGQISRRTRLAHHPWVADIEKEIRQLDEEAAETIPDDGLEEFGRGGDLNDES